MHICCMCFITVVVYFDTDALPHTNTPQRKNASSNCRKAEYETCVWLKTKDRQNQSPRRLAGKLWSFQMKIPKKLANRFDTTKQDRSYSTNWMKFIFWCNHTCSALFASFCVESALLVRRALHVPLQCLSLCPPGPCEIRPRYAVLGTGPNGLPELFIWSYLILFVHFDFGRVNTALILCVSIVLRLLNDRKSIQSLRYWSHYWELYGR